ncbi:tumor necrosis factor receptor superfamily member 1B [Kryptolebias marmoratus]|uniref:Tumor necrosis factor receptor superfamily, member 1B n=1 Tax=Kryptolebias marmoratus TaxID=37003 RepID=A0A3Q3A985_KRYMA|nr:tumor necrosis factor receptor superfamily member 1B [Kryptolebias marmoratus]
MWVTVPARFLPPNTRVVVRKLLGWECAARLHEVTEQRAGCRVLSSQAAMKDKLLLLLLLLAVRTTQVCSVPYPPGSGGKCRNTSSEYLHETLNVCCKKCPPGYRQATECSETTETYCQPCQQGRYTETWNFSPNCLSCLICKEEKGLQYSQICTTTTKSKCVCQPGKFCVIGFKDPYCSDCMSYTKCKPGYGVVKPGTLNSDVKCGLCPNGTFSDKDSHTDPCRPLSVAVDTTTTSPTTVRDTTCQSDGFSVSTVGSSLSSKSHLKDWVPVIAGVTGLLGFLFIVILLLCLYTRTWRKDSASLQPKVDANGNCETTDEVGQNYVVESKTTSLTLTSPEQVRLLEKGREGGDQNQCSSNSETLPKADDYTSHDCSSSLHPTSAPNSLTSALSEPMTLLSNTELASPQASVPAQCSSQPTSPQIVSPVTNSPHVNVNITLHIGNGSCGSPPFKSTDLSQEEYKLPFGQEEESFSTPQQEAGDLSKTSVLESVYCNT